MSNQIPAVLSALNYTHVDEFPKECLDWIVSTVKDKGLEGLKAAKFQTASCVFCLLSWAFGKVQDKPVDPDHPDDGVLFADQETIHISDCNCELVKHINLPMEASAEDSIGAGPIVNMMIKLLIQYLLESLGDSDKLEEIIKQVMAWLAKQS